MNRVDDELPLLRRRFPDLEYVADGQWVRIVAYPLPVKLWRSTLAEIAFQIPPDAATAPYAFYARAVAGSDVVRPQLAVVSDEPLKNVTGPASTPWGDDFFVFSWVLEEWLPAEPITAGSTMVEFARSIRGRFEEGA